MQQLPCVFFRFGPEVPKPQRSCCTDCILAWQLTDRPRAALNLRYYSGSAWARREQNIGAGAEGNLVEKLTLSSVATVEGLAPCTRAMAAGRCLTAWGEPRVPRL